MAKSNHNKYVSYPDWFGSSTTQPAQQLLVTQTIYYGSGGSSSGSEGSGGAGGAGLTGVITQGSGNAVTSGTLDGTTLVLNKDLMFATDQSNTNTFWELREDLNGKSYLYANYDIATLGGHTMYVDGDDVLSLPGLYDGLPIDWDTIYWEDTKDGKVLKAKFEESSWVDASEVLNIVSNAGYATQSWIDDQKFINNSTLSSILSDYVTVANYQEITGEKNFTGGLRVNNSPVIYYDEVNKYWKLEGDLLVTGGLTQYGNDSSFVPSTIMDGIVTDEKTISKQNGYLEVIGGISGGVDITDIPIATTNTKGIASFDANSFSVTNGAVDLKTKIVISKGVPTQFNNNTLYIIT